MQWLLVFQTHPQLLAVHIYELGVLSDLRVGEKMYNCKGITLSWDSTTVNGDHINEIHNSVATSPPKSYVLSLKPIAGGTTDDYTSHICESIHNIYATFHSLEYVYTKTTILKNLKNTLCDRVAVNHCVVQSAKFTRQIRNV